MTSRPPLGVQQRQPQRSLSGSGGGAGGGLSQRPPAARTLSQHLPPSPIRKETNFHDASPVHDPNDVAQQQQQARYGGTTQRRGGSRLKLELSHDSVDSFTHAGLTESPQGLDSSKPFTPSRMMPATASELGDMSPHRSVGGQTSEPDGPLPLPPRRMRFAPSPPRSQQTSHAAPQRRDNRPRPYTVEIPAEAPRFGTQGKGESQAKPLSFSPSGTSPGVPKTGYADFCPWTGDHPEDKFTDTVIRQGFFDKLPANLNETSSAKTALSAALKHKSGLHALSTIFTGILGERRHIGRITAPSTFKPPPRVTLTDTKRENWLKDLSNSSIPLRRLSRTIPHGVRGKLLLEQCLNKKVPTDRAVWLAKCVGANEIRAFKRKGVNGAMVMNGNGEAKWIRDWTVFVEQFLESVISGFGDTDWKWKVNYAIRLATHFYAEYLLDREHYMEWLVSNFENSTIPKLPMWMLVTQIYWKDLLQLRRFGKRLVATLLRRNSEVQKHPDKDLLLPLSTKLTSMLNFLIVHSPANFISPADWFAHRDAVQATILVDDHLRKQAYQRINIRNEQLRASTFRSQPATRRILVRMLDTSLQAPMYNELAVKSWKVAEDKPLLTRALLDWCTSMHRPGMAKVYVASRIIKYWSTLGIDVTMTILDFMESEALEELERKKSLYQLVGELARSGHFSVPRYMQWLIARGGITSQQDITPEGPATTRLLVELPVHALGLTQQNMRGGILRRASFVVEDEQQDTELAKKFVRHAIGMAFDITDPFFLQNRPSVNKVSKRLGKSSQALRMEIGCWLRDQFAVAFNPQQKDAVVDIPSEVFYSVRSVLESTEDFSMLAEFVGAMTRSSNVEILASCADTVNRHLTIFAALGALKDLFDTLYGRLKIIAGEQTIAARPLLASLVCIASRIPSMSVLASQLKNDLTLTDRNNPVDACSPVSDNMAAQLQDDDSDLQEEIEKLLSSGTSMDRGTMDRLFQTVIQRLESCWSKVDAYKQRAYGQLLTRLRMFDNQHFDRLMGKWLLYLRTLSSRPSVLLIFPMLVSVGCLSMSTILSTASGGDQSETAADGSARATTVGIQTVHKTYRTRYMQEILQLFMAPIVPNGMVLPPEECYRFTIYQEQAQRENPKEVIALIRNAVAEWVYARGQNDTQGLPLDDKTTRERLQGLLRLLVLKDPTAVARALSVKSSDPQVTQCMEYLTTKLLVPTASLETHITFDQILELTDEFTLHFAQVKIFVSLNSGSADSSIEQTNLELLATAMEKAIDGKKTNWTSLLPYLGADLTHYLKTRAQARLLDILPSRKNPSATDEHLEERLQMANSFMAVIEGVTRNSSMSRPPQYVPAMIDRLADQWEILAAPTDPDETAAACNKPAVLAHWLPLLLNLITLQIQTFDGAVKASHEARAKAMIVSCGLLQELDLLHGPGIDRAAARSLGERLFDLACVIADGLSEESRALCIRAAKDVTSDVRVRYLMSFAQQPLENVMLSMREKQGAGEAVAGLGVGVAGGGMNPCNTTTSSGSGCGGAGPGTGGMAAARAAGPMPGGGLLGTPSTLWGIDNRPGTEKLVPFQARRWEILSEPTPIIGENDTALSLRLFEARRL